jgi:hypothetical protein
MPIERGLSYEMPFMSDRESAHLEILRRMRGPALLI